VDVGFQGGNVGEGKLRVGTRVEVGCWEVGVGSESMLLRVAVGCCKVGVGLPGVVEVEGVTVGTDVFKFA